MKYWKYSWHLSAIFCAMWDTSSDSQTFIIPVPRFTVTFQFFKTSPTIFCIVTLWYDNTPSVSYRSNYASHAQEDFSCMIIWRDKAVLSENINWIGIFPSILFIALVPLSSTTLCSTRAYRNRPLANAHEGSRGIVLYHVFLLSIFFFRFLYSRYPLIPLRPLSHRRQLLVASDAYVARLSAYTGILCLREEQ